MDSHLNGVKNEAFDASEQQHILPTISGAVNVMEKKVTKDFLQHEQNSNAVLEPLTNHNADEISLQMLPARETYRRLCSCEEEGRTCQCRAGVRDGNSNLKFESWGRWKNIALITVTALVGIWAVVYITLSQIRLV